MLKGVNASEGIGIGKVMLIEEVSLDYEKKQITDTQAEIDRYRKVFDAYCEKTEKQAENIKNTIGEKEADIILGHLLMLKDPAMSSSIEGNISSGCCAEDAVAQVCDMFIGVFSMADDELTKQRASDVEDIKNGLITMLLGKEEVDIASAPSGTVLVAKDLTPSMTSCIVKENIVGIVTEVGGKTSHSAILARAMEIPAVLSVPNVMETFENGQEIIVDGSHGEVIENPSDGEIAIYREKTIEYKKEKEELKKFIGKETVTADGVKVELCCNIGKPDDADAVLSKDGEGVGLFRTEFLYMDSSSIPTEEEQFEAYKKTVLKLGDKPLIIRTLDVGGDKDIPYLGLSKEDNPFMGFRAVRYCLHREDVYKPQLRALLRASAFGNIKIMIPLVTCIDEVREVKAMIENIKAELDSENIAYNKDIQVGVMVETPAASLIADLLAEEADFFSIGTNDLTGYTMAVDRGNADVAYLYSAFQPAVLRSIKKIIEDGKDIMVGMCGEAAADPLLIPLLLAFGLDEFSVSATSVLKTRKIISQWTIDEAKEVANKALTLKTESEVVEYLTSVAK
ncbi:MULTISPECIES: phosphoenolpyruvate--protein phosphotransferase [Ruminococcus]|uniref:Phosphoenolpyruvate-protein phosphotransferase n=1 Tax=Ruminococcus bovis TaxID=2564099 RepID=A0A4P8XYI2_9FIRM|nr:MULTISPECIES: phosphoenolpyruvate--protein phosphotransferase [Ruminococcus]MEE3438497.1 phosphoenolpyruvate--protein phosphotransferase [Ruminococcus sp.]QCT05918.1 phosphoenolpyruvate--protein phosphotransferase [Ruminococcus bovis]